MKPRMLLQRLNFWLSRVRERLWVRPLTMALVSVGGVFGAKIFDGSPLGELAPDVSAESIGALLSVMAASMLVIATLAVTSMVSAYASASSSATPRAFTLVVADDSSQNALSTFIGAFIFSIVALTALKNEYFGGGARFAIFVLMGLVFSIVILTFVRWVDHIARLGRIGSTIERVERAARAALRRRRVAPTLGGVPAHTVDWGRVEIEAADIGYVQHIDIDALQQWACALDRRIVVAALPGAFVAPGRPLLRLDRAVDDAALGALREAFVVGEGRLYDDDPRFGLVVLGEIAARALSPGINDPGTAIDIIGRLVRLFAYWATPCGPDERRPAQCDRVAVPALEHGDLFEDAFTAIARDGAGMLEVAIRLQKALQVLTVACDGALRAAAIAQSRRALTRAERALPPEDYAAVRAVAAH